MKIIIEHHYITTEEFKEIKHMLCDINKTLINIMQTLKDLQNAVTAENTVIDSAIVLLNGLSAQIANLSVDQASIDALATEVQAKADELAAAVVANTPVV